MIIVWWWYDDLSCIFRTLSSIFMIHKVTINVISHVFALVFASNNSILLISDLFNLFV